MMVNYEEEYDKFEDRPNNIDYGSWYEYDNFQDFLDGKNAMDLTEGEEIDYLILHMPQEEILDFNELRDDESIYREIYVNELIERKLLEKESLEEALKSMEVDEIDYEYLESISFENGSMEDIPIGNINGDDLEEMTIKDLIERRLKEEEDLNKEFLRNRSLEIDMDEPMDEIGLEEFYEDFDYDYTIEEKYYEHRESLDELYYKIQESKKREMDDDPFNEITDYGDNRFED